MLHPGSLARLTVASGALPSSIFATLESRESRLHSFPSNPMRFAWSGTQLRNLDKSATTVRLSLRLVRQEPENSISDLEKCTSAFVHLRHFGTSAPIHLSLARFGTLPSFHRRHASSAPKLQPDDEPVMESIRGSSSHGTIWFKGVSQTNKKTSRNLSSNSKYEIQGYCYLLINVQ